MTMKSTFLLYLAAAALPAFVFSENSTTAPVGCRKLSTDSDWPTPDIWQAAIPEVVQSNGTDSLGRPLPNYRIRAKNVGDVQAAVKFAAEHNIRLTVIATGHDQLGRSDAGSGLIIDVSLMKNVQVLASFSPSASGAESPNYTIDAPNVITPIDGVEAAVTFGPAVVGLALNYAVSPSGLFTTSGAAAGVAVGGGWGQNGGYGPLSAQYGLGVDQWLEAKIVTADGQLRVANNITNPDLFWAIRGGGGGTFGVVVQATWRAHRNVPITGYNWYINSTIVGPNVTNPTTGASPISEAMQYLLGEMPGLQAKGISGFFYVGPSSVRAYAIHPAANAGVARANEVWEPILTKMQPFTNMTPFQTKPYEFANYREFFDTTYGPYVPEYGPDAPPYNRGIMTYDSRLLAAEHLQSPRIIHALRGTGGSYGVLLVAPGPSHGSGNKTSAHPGWRRAVVHLAGWRADGLNVDGLRELAPDMGAYINEASYQEENWSESFWGPNYPRLSALKSKYDPDMAFWQSPGIHADHMQSISGRACLVLPAPETPSALLPKSDRSYIADLTGDGGFLRGSLELIGVQYPAPGTQIGLQNASIYG